MKTKPYVRFLNTAAQLDADVELADVVNIAKNEGRLHSDGSTHVFDFIDPAQHPRLANRTNNDHNRTLAVRHLKATLCSSYLKDLYEDVTKYLQELLEAAARNGLDPDRLVGEHKVSFEANDLLQSGSWDSVVHLVSQAVFRRLETERSTQQLLQKMNAKLNLGVADATIDAALPYLELRHLLIHNDGVADDSFCTRFPAFGATADAKLTLDFSVLQQARQAILALVAEFDTQAITHNVVSAADQQR